MNKAIDAMIQDDADLKDNDDVSTGGQIYYRPHSGEGNVFTSVCHSLHRGVSARGGVCPERCLPGGVSGQTPTRDGHCHGRYTSYWNAFLFRLLLARLESAYSFEETFWLFYDNWPIS